MKIRLKDKDIDYIKSENMDGDLLELRRLDDNYWALFLHTDDHVTELLTLHYKDWVVLCKMLTKR